MLKKFIEFFVDVLFVISLIYLGTEAFRYLDPYDYNYYYDLIINRVDDTKITVNKNKYYKDNDYMYVQNIEYLYPHNKQEVLNILYTFINSGEKEITFYCPKDYNECQSDAKALIYDKENNVVSSLYEFSHPFNDYKSLSCGVNEDTGSVTYHKKKKYTNKKIKEIEKEVDRLYDELVDPNKSDKDNIMNIHDYLVNTVEYDRDKSDFIDKKTDVDSIYDSTSAYGALIEKHAICGGYTDAMYLFLEKMGIKSYRVASKSHIWNGVYLDGEWLHLDVTWDDARYTNGVAFLRHKYFLVDTNTLLENDSKSHSFPEDIYLEFKR